MLALVQAAAYLPRSLWNYLDVLKPRETVLLAFLGVAAVVLAGGGWPPGDLVGRVLVVVLLGSAGTNGLTNYLDRRIDARMVRTHLRALPSARISPAEKVLPLTLGLILTALVLSWFLHPWAFVAGAVGVVAAVTYRKTAYTHLLGGISGCAPVVIGYLAVRGGLDATIVALCVVVFVWVPLHVWSVMVAYRDQYLGSGLAIFPATWRLSTAVRVLALLAALVYAASLAFYAVAGLGLVYLVGANVLGLAMLAANLRLLRSPSSRQAWVVHKLSAYPYLGLLFLTILLDLWI